MRQIQIIGVFLVFVFGTVFLNGCGSKESTEERRAGTNPQRRAVVNRGIVTDPAKVKEAKRFLIAGVNSLSAGDVPEAIKNFDQAIIRNPLDSHPYLVLGQTYMRLRHYDRAADTFEAVTRVAPNNGLAYYLLSVCRGLEGKKKSAVEAAQRSVEIFQKQKNEEYLTRSLALLQGLVNSNSSGESTRERQPISETDVLDTGARE